MARIMGLRGRGRLGIERLGSLKVGFVEKYYTAGRPGSKSG
jgi:hypothetical protein